MPRRGTQRSGGPVIRRLAAVLAVPLVLVMGTAVAAVGSGSLDPRGAGGDVVCLPVAPGQGRLVAGTTLDAVQLANARTIRDVGIALAVPPRGQVIAIATAVTESALRNLDHGDADSLGLFQQRPSAGWGTAAEILDPVYSATRFYRALQQIPNWQTLALTVAAQQVQRSAFPDRYAAWEPVATALVAAQAGIAGTCATLNADTPLSGDTAAALPAGFTLPVGTPVAVATAITWALRQLGTPYQWGGTCTDPHGTNPAERCDCSSLVQQAYRAAGVTLTRTTSTQIHQGASVPGPDQLLPGDLIFLPGHVGLYLGAGLVLHAPHTGDVVKISLLRPYWTSNWVAARRVVG